MTLLPALINRRPIIGVLASWQVYAGTLNTLLSPILHGIYDAACERDVNILMACGMVSDFSGGIRAAWPAVAPEVDFLPVGAWNTDGLIIIAPNMSDAIQANSVHELRESRHPLVFAFTSEMIPAVGIDNAGGIRQALEHLESHGHKKIAFIAADEGRVGDGMERLQAYLDFYHTRNLPADPRLLAYGHFTTPGGYTAMKQILASGADFNAVLASNDESAVGVMQALREAGLRVPQDVAVIGFDNRFEARNQSPPLTTVSQPAYELGRESLALMLQSLAGNAGENVVLRVQSPLVIRESCGCQPGALLPDPHPDETSPGEWAETISAAVFAQVGLLHLETVREFSARLVEGFTASVENGNPAQFQSALDHILAFLSTLDEDAHAWQTAIHLLRHRWLDTANPDPRHTQVLEWLDHARMSISECAQTQLLRYFARQNAATQQHSLMSADLGEAVDVTTLQSILDRYTPNLGIRHARLVLFEHEADDPVAWSVLPGAESASRRFPSRSFPPANLYPDPDTWQLALLPLLVQKQPAGFIAFDAADLYPCLAVARQVASTLESIRLYREAAEGRQLAEEANRLKSRFLSTVSHELRTPLNLIVGWSEMLLNDPGADAARFAGHIHTSAQHLGRLIRDVLDLASSDAGQLRLTCEPLDLSEALQMVAETGRQLATEKGLVWQADLPAGLPLVWGDRTRLQQITLNLVSNAIKFTSKGHVALHVFAEEPWIEVAVQDTGLGIAPAEQPWIFDEFRQSERTTARGYGGLGLGLAICKRLVELHQGEVGVSSSGEEGSGSRFFFRLPVLDSAESSAPEPRSGSVLILTSRPDSGDLIRVRLERAGFAALLQVVDDNPDWLASLLVTPPGAVILDESLAAQYGWELLKVLKGNPQTVNIPVMFYTLEGESGSVLALDYLMKPVGAEDLVQALKRQGWGGRLRGSGERMILIADDDPGMLEMNSRLIQDRFPKYNVLKAGDGRAALDILAKTPVNLVLLDLMMPEVDGFGVLAKMREWEHTRETSVIVLTSKTLTEADMARLNEGVAMVMGKGLYAADETLAHIESALGRNPRLGSDSQRLARKAMAYIHVHYTEQVTRDELAQYVNASDGHLARCFRQETGLSPMAYLNRYRVQQAQLKLTGTQQSVTAIALSCGFSDVNYFSRVFHQETGMTPLAYRKSKYKV